MNSTMNISQFYSKTTETLSRSLTSFSNTLTSFSNKFVKHYTHMRELSPISNITTDNNSHPELSTQRLPFPTELIKIISPNKKLITNVLLLLCTILILGYLMYTLSSNFMVKKNNNYCEPIIEIEKKLELLNETTNQIKILELKIDNKQKQLAEHTVIQQELMDKVMELDEKVFDLSEQVKTNNNRSINWCKKVIYHTNLYSVPLSFVEKMKRYFNEWVVDKDFITQQKNLFGPETSGQLQPGECIPLNGSQGYLDIELIKKIIITKIEYVHLHPEKIPDDYRGSMPQHFQFLAKQFTDDEWRVIGFGNFGYEDTSRLYLIDEKENDYDIFRIKVLNNYGEDFTCLYRIRVHGYLPKKLN